MNKFPLDLSPRLPTRLSLELRLPIHLSLHLELHPPTHLHLHLIPRLHRTQQSIFQHRIQLRWKDVAEIASSNIQVSVHPGMFVMIFNPYTEYPSKKPTCGLNMVMPRCSDEKAAKNRRGPRGIFLLGFFLFPYRICDGLCYFVCAVLRVELAAACGISKRYVSMEKKRAKRKKQTRILDDGRAAY